MADPIQNLEQLEDRLSEPNEKLATSVKVW
jgi:hypothetical protein